MKKILTIVLCSVMSIGLFAQEATTANKDKYTFGDFFDALDLPTVLGVGFTPNGIEGATFIILSVISYKIHQQSYELIKRSKIKTLTWSMHSPEGRSE